MRCTHILNEEGERDVQAHKNSILDPSGVSERDREKEYKRQIKICETESLLFFFLGLRLVARFIY